MSMAPFAPRAYSTQKRFLSIAIILLTAIALYTFCITLSRITQDTPDAVYGVDFIAYYTAAQLVQSGNSSEIYAELTDDFSVVDKGTFYETARQAGFPLTPTRYVYLPVFLLPFTLLTRFNFETASLIWLWVNLAAIAAILYLQWRITKGLPHPFLRLMVITILNLSSFPLVYALKLGQTTIIVYLFVCLIYYFTVKREDCFSGIFLGIIIALKFSPLLFLLYFLYKKRYALVISSSLTVAAVVLISLITCGVPLHTAYWNYLGEISSLRIAAWSNQSIDAFVLRFFTGAAVTSFNPVNASVLLSTLSYLCSLAMIVITCLCLRKADRSNDGHFLPLEFCLLITCLLITPPISWLHYYMLAVLSTLLILTVCYTHSLCSLRYLLPSLILSYGIVAFHIDHRVLIETFGQGYATRLLVSLPFAGACALFLITVFLIRVMQRSSKSLTTRNP